MKRATKLSVALLASAIGASACSVSTPRHGSTALRARGAVTRSAQDASGAVDSATGSGATAPADAVAGDASAPASGSGAGAGRAGATGSATGAGAAAPGTAGDPRSATPRSSAGLPVGPATGVSRESVTVSVVAGFSGVLAAMVVRAYDGLLTWQGDVNAAGGINGRKVILKKVDHKETADGGIAACKQVLSNGSFFALVPEGVDGNITAVNCLDAAGLPTLYFSPTTDPKWSRAFADSVTAAQGGKAMGSYVRNTLGGAGKKVGVMYVNQPSYKALVDTFGPEARRRGLTIAAVQAVEPNQASFTPQLLRMQNAGVQILIISATAETVGILRDARAMGFNPKFTGWGFMFDFLTVGARNVFDGVTGIRPYATTDTPAFDQYAERMRARGRGRTRTNDLEGFTAYGHALVLGEILRRAGSNPSHESLVAGTETIEHLDVGVFPPNTFGPGHHAGTDAVFPVVCCNPDYTWKGQGPARAVF